MKQFSLKCIVCGKDLPPENERGKHGEHIIPKVHGGCVAIKDVCNECNRYFGDNIDLLLLKDGRIIQAVGKLGIENLKRIILDNATITSKDTIDGHNVPMVYRNGDYQIKPQELNSEIIEMSEEKSKKYWEEKIKKRIKSGELPKESLKEFKDKEWPSYEQSRVNETFVSSIPDVAMRKRQVSKPIPEFDVSIEQSKRAVAKIAYEFAYVLTPEENMARIWNDLDVLRQIARYNKPIPEMMFVYQNIKKKYAFTHEIMMQYPKHMPSMVFMDIVFFGTVDYRIILRSNKGQLDPIRLPDTKQSVDMIGLAMEFYPNQPKRKYVGIHSVEDDRWTSYDFTGLI
ncbi:MAG: HNH endonuclease [Candidatus Electryonea clarkiae]|nr:HNH endonuclease [Candidatus Electryonea clarkiae]MDP8285508.1 HNH endonuclease [Candidatus Electryonea clarkiae]